MRHAPGPGNCGQKAAFPRSRATAAILQSGRNAGHVSWYPHSRRLADPQPVNKLAMPTKVLISGQRRGLIPKLKKLLRRRSAIEPEISHMKTDGRH